MMWFRVIVIIFCCSQFAHILASDVQLIPYISVAAVAKLDTSKPIPPEEKFGIAYEIQRRQSNSHDNNNEVSAFDRLRSENHGYPIRGHWGIPRDDFKDHKTYIKLLLHAKDKVLTELQKEISHERREIGSVTQQGSVFFDGQKLLSSEEVQALYLIPPTELRAPSQYTCFELVHRKKFVERGEQLYVEPFQIPSEKGKKSNNDFKGYYSGCRALNAEEKASSLGLADALMYYDGKDFFLPYIDQRAWQKKETGEEIGFIIISCDKNWQIAFNDLAEIVDRDGSRLDKTKRFFKKGLYKRLSEKNIEERGLRQECWIRLRMDNDGDPYPEHEVYVQLSQYDQSFLPYLCPAFPSFEQSIFKSASEESWYRSVCSNQDWFLANCFRKSALFNAHHCGEFIVQTIVDAREKNRTRSHVKVKQISQSEGLAVGLFHYAVTRLYLTGEPLELLSFPEDKKNYGIFRKVLNQAMSEQKGNSSICQAAKFYRAYLCASAGKTEKAIRRLRQLLFCEKPIDYSKMSTNYIHCKCIRAAIASCLVVLLFSDRIRNVHLLNGWPQGIKSDAKFSGAPIIASDFNPYVEGSLADLERDILCGTNEWALIIALPIIGYLKFFYGLLPQKDYQKSLGIFFLSIAALQNLNMLAKNSANDILQDPAFSERWSENADGFWIDKKRFVQEGINYVLSESMLGLPCSNCYSISDYTSHNPRRDAIISALLDPESIILLKFICEHFRPNLNFRNEMHPLFTMAISWGKFCHVKLLIDHGANINARGALTPFEMALNHNNPRIAAFLFSLGARGRGFADNSVDREGFLKVFSRIY